LPWIENATTGAAHPQVAEIRESARRIREQGREGRPLSPVAGPRGSGKFLAFRFRIEPASFARRVGSVLVVENMDLKSTDPA
jgi:hypothetical protein